MEKKEDNKICSICGKIIAEFEHYHKKIEINNYKEVGIIFFHDKCFNNFINTKKYIHKSMDLMRGLVLNLQKEGIIPKQQEEFKII